MVLGDSSLKRFFQPLLGKPCWGVKQGYGSFLTLEFGKPNQEVDRVRRLGNAPTASRIVVIRGEWHLWIYCCGWRIYQDGKRLADHQSDDSQIVKACAQLDGQALRAFDLSMASGESSFDFDLGGRLDTFPLDEQHCEQWSLTCLGGPVFGYRSDGAIYFEPEDCVSGEEQWMRIA